MAVEDGLQEFREIFAREADARLGRLRAHLLDIETRGPESELMTAVCREAHTLTGTSGMVGLPEISRIARAMEERLRPYRPGGTEPPVGLVDALLDAVDSIRVLVPRLVAGGPAEGAVAGEVEGVERRLRDAP